jgi:hypothetical protein
VLFRQFEEEKVPTKSWNSAVAFAETKLFGSQTLESTERRQKFGLLATVLARIASFPLKTSRETDWWNSHMGTILSLTDDRTVLRVGYPVKPVVFVPDLSTPITVFNFLSIFRDRDE